MESWGSGPRWVRGKLVAREAVARAKDIGEDLIAGHPVAVESLGDFAGGRAAAEGVEHEVARTGQELDKELGESGGEARGMDGEVVLAASLEVTVA